MAVRLGGRERRREWLAAIRLMLGILDGLSNLQHQIVRRISSRSRLGLRALMP